MNNKREKEDFLFTSECVTEGHPDKMCDIISDSILDAYLKEDPNSRVACETSVKNDKIFVFGEISSLAKIDVKKIVRQKALELCNYSNSSTSEDEDAKNLNENPTIILELDRQSAEIANSLHEKEPAECLGAGDQGMMFGYATDESAELMPLSLILARKICLKLTELQKTKEGSFLRKDGKSQVTLEYKQITEDGIRIFKPVRAHSIVISTQHKEGIDGEKLRNFLIEEVIKKVVDESLLDNETKYYLNQSGSFVIGGPFADSGLTGRKIIVDSYGGWGSHGGGAFSGKDATKVDRSGAYFARFVAKSLVANKLCRRVLVQVAYCIGFSKPLCVYIDTYGTGSICDREIEEIVMQNFDFRPGKIIERLKLKQPLYEKTAREGHFGNEHEDFEWEKVAKIDISKN